MKLTVYVYKNEWHNTSDSITLFPSLELAQQEFINDFLRDDRHHDEEQFEQVNKLVADGASIADQYEKAKELYDDEEGNRDDWYGFEAHEVDLSQMNLPLRTKHPEGSREAKIVAMADDKFGKEGDLEFDTDAEVSDGDDNGAYVQCWKWLDFKGTEFDREKE